MIQHVHAATEVVNLAYNPFNGVTPGFGPFHGIFKSKLQMFLALAWAVCFFFVAYQLIIAITSLSQARKGGYGDSLDDAKTDSLKAAGALVLLSAAPILYGTLASV